MKEKFYKKPFIDFIRNLTYNDILKYNKSMFLTDGRIKFKDGSIYDEDSYEKLFNYQLNKKDKYYEPESMYKNMDIYLKVKKIISQMISEKIGFDVDPSMVVFDFPDKSKKTFYVTHNKLKFIYNDEDEVKELSHFMVINSMPGQNDILKWTANGLESLSDDEYENYRKYQLLMNIYHFDKHNIPLNIRQLLSDDSKTLNDVIYWKTDGDFSNNSDENDNLKKDIFEKNAVSDDGKWLVKKSKRKDYFIDFIQFEFEWFNWLIDYSKKYNFNNFDISKYFISLDTKTFYDKLCYTMMSDKKYSMNEKNIFDKLYSLLKTYDYIKDIEDLSWVLDMPIEYCKLIKNYEKVNMDYFLTCAYVFCLNCIKALQMKNFEFTIKNDLIENKLKEIINDILEIKNDLLDNKNYEYDEIEIKDYLE